MMPKKNASSGEMRKRRSASKDSRNSSNAVVEDGLLPPTPTASHLFALNPFDEPLNHNATNNNAVFRNSPRIFMTGSLHASVAMTGCYPKGQPLSHSNWKPGMTPSLHPETVRFDAPLGFTVKSGLVDMRSRGTRPTPYQIETQLSPSPGHSFGNQTHPKSVYQVADPADEPMYRHRKMNSTSASNVNRSNTKNIERDAKSDQVPWSTKVKRRSKAADLLAKCVTWKGDHDWTTLPAAVDNKPSASFVTNGIQPPHAIAPSLPQLCKQCNKDIKHIDEDCICCLASCKSWYHRLCCGLSEAALNCLKNEDLALWACDKCLSVSEIGSVRTRNSTDTPVRNLISDTLTKS